MTSPPPHKDLVDAAKLIDPKAWENMPQHQLNGFAIATFSNCLRRQRKAIRQASAVARFLLSRELSPGALHDGEGYMDLVHIAEHLNHPSGRQAEFACGYQAANIRRLKELGLDAKEGT